MQYPCECGGMMIEEEILVSRTTSPDEDDQFETLLVCQKCRRQDDLPF